MDGVPIAMATSSINAVKTTISNLLDRFIIVPLLILKKPSKIYDQIFCRISDPSHR
jgi:hypothetical protein